MWEDEGEEVKEKEEGMTWFCSFLRKYSHQGSQDDEAAELSEKYMSNIS